MKKFVLLLSAMFLFGCGIGTGSGTGTSPSVSGVGDTTVSPNNVGQTASFMLNLQNSGPISTAKVMASLAGPTSTPTKARVVVRQFNTVPHHVLIYDGPEDSDGFPTASNPPRYNDYNTYEETYRRVLDAAIANDNTITFTTPVSVGSEVYEFDVVTYAPVVVDGNNVNMMIKFGTVNNVTVAANSGANVTMNNLSDTVNDTLPLGSIKTESLFQATFTSVLNNPFRKNFDLDAKTNNSNSSVTARGLDGRVLLLTAPSSSDSSDTLLNFNVKFYIADAMLDPRNSADKYTNFICIFTDSAPFATLATVTQSTI